MKRVLLALIAPMLVVLAAGASATTVTHAVATVGDTTTFTYTLTSGESSDFITSFHVYAPTDWALLSGWSITPGWEFAADLDAETGGADAYWYAVNPVQGGLAFGRVLQVVLTAPSTLRVKPDYVVPGYLGNWGFETLVWAGCGPFVMTGSVPVPEGAAPAVPEPGSILVLAAGCAAIRLSLRGCRR